MVSIIPLTSGYTNLFSRFWRPFQEHQLRLVLPPSLSTSLATSKCLPIFSLSLVFTLWLIGTARSTKWQIIFVLLINKRLDLLAEICSSVWISEFQTILRVVFSRAYSDLCICHLSVWPNFNFLHNSYLIIFPTQTCLQLYSLCITFLYLHIM